MNRFARSLKMLISGLEMCSAFGIDFVSVTEAVDTSLPAGGMMFQMIGAVAQFERSLISERVKSGLEHARKKIPQIPRRQFFPNLWAAFFRAAKSPRINRRLFERMFFSRKAMSLSANRPFSNVSSAYHATKLVVPPQPGVHHHQFGHSQLTGRGHRV